MGQLDAIQEAIAEANTALRTDEGELLAERGPLPPLPRDTDLRRDMAERYSPAAEVLGGANLELPCELQDTSSLHSVPSMEEGFVFRDGIMGTNSGRTADVSYDLKRVLEATPDMLSWADEAPLLPSPDDPMTEMNSYELNVGPYNPGVKGYDSKHPHGWSTALDAVRHLITSPQDRARFEDYKRQPIVDTDRIDVTEAAPVQRAEHRALVWTLADQLRDRIAITPQEREKIIGEFKAANGRDPNQHEIKQCYLSKLQKPDHRQIGYLETIAHTEGTGEYVLSQVRRGYREAYCRDLAIQLHQKLTETDKPDPAGTLKFLRDNFRGRTKEEVQEFRDVYNRLFPVGKVGSGDGIGRWDRTIGEQLRVHFATTDTANLDPEFKQLGLSGSSLAYEEASTLLGGSDPITTVGDLWRVMNHVLRGKNVLGYQIPLGVGGASEGAAVHMVHLLQALTPEDLNRAKQLWARNGFWKGDLETAVRTQAGGYGPAAVELDQIFSKNRPAPMLPPFTVDVVPLREVVAPKPKAQLREHALAVFNDTQKTDSEKVGDFLELISDRPESAKAELRSDDFLQLLQQRFKSDDLRPALSGIFNAGATKVRLAKLDHAVQASSPQDLDAFLADPKNTARWYRLAMVYALMYPDRQAELQEKWNAVRGNVLKSTIGPSVDAKGNITLCPRKELEVRLEGLYGERGTRAATALQDLFDQLLNDQEIVKAYRVAYLQHVATLTNEAQKKRGRLLNPNDADHPDLAAQDREELAGLQREAKRLAAAEVRESDTGVWRQRFAAISGRLLRQYDLDPTLMSNVLYAVFPDRKLLCPLEEAIAATPEEEQQQNEQAMMESMQDQIQNLIK